LLGVIKSLAKADQVEQEVPDLGWFEMSEFLIFAYKLILTMIWDNFRS